ncbi:MULTISPECIES: glycosyltransferase [unclassified Lactococcus]|uniref:glycosyltransferase n=1 Tax=unclassified Lactococcus TaxID=2643510 RepID=UPI00129798D3|nr:MULTISPECIES: glycosyltransferase [unclassified Lactococcus]
MKTFFFVWSNIEKKKRILVVNYFVNENIFALNSGTEFSAINRIKLFKKNKISAKIVTRNYNTQLAADAKRLGLESSDVVNMYDYFQELVGLEMERADVRFVDMIDKTKYHIEGVDANSSLISHHGTTIGKINIAPATVGLVGSVDYFGTFGDTLTTDLWDCRGFKSSTQYYHPDGSKGTQVFFNKDGQPKLELAHMNINGQLFPTMYRLVDYKGESWRFNTEEELFTFFLDELAAQGEASLINDRISLAPAVHRAKGFAGKWHFLHNVHSSNNQQVGPSRQLVDYLKPLFTEFNAELDGIIVPTEQERDEIMKFYHFNNVLALPDYFTKDVKFEIPKTKNKIIHLGRLADDKGVIQTVEVMNYLHQMNPEAELDFYGYASPAEMQKQLDEKVEAFGLQDVVHFRGYQNTEILEAAIKEARAVISTTPAESFGMELLEAMSFGVPVVAYDVKYGHKELIDNGKNGVLVPLGATLEAAQALNALIVDDSKHLKMSKAAHEKAQKWHEALVWKKWTKVQKTSSNLFVKGEK